ncbi:MAG: hypothetical protein U5O16_14350 [Rhodococcus sp. (in: high G+C Gram-positive bacteria)]|uniref:hypothetical protein n=1 Tax=Rhodococcus TaxID=1827 RepID=UPI0021B10B94|nr:hypothetical protein [Rhodococcus qingshengii]MCT6735287.1 hypothetical protein [Rhodococcus qingshengii]MDZ7912993.1 hypothetical protein [Rhodococcus sp. (in: high G+C Gram-positive bacteria)]
MARQPHALTIEPVDLSPLLTHTIPTVATELGISRPMAERLIRAELGGPASFDGTNLTATNEAMNALLTQRDRWADTSVHGIAVRVGPAWWSPEEGRYIGWHRRLDGKYRDDAIRQVWAVRGAPELVGAAFLATIGGWITEVRSIVDVEPVHGGWAFDLGPCTQTQQRAYSGRRIPSTPGRQVIRLGES